MRVNYCQHLQAITNEARQLIISLSYDQDLCDGPPHSVNTEEIRTHYDEEYEIEILEENFLEKGMKGQFDCYENVYLLKKERLISNSINRSFRLLLL